MTYSYDEEYRLLTTSRGGASTTLNYDFGGRKISLSDPDMGNWAYTYDALNNLTSQTDARSGGGCVTTLSYDPLNRLTGKSYNGNCGATTTAVTFTYDYGTNGIGRRTGMSDGSGSTSWAYDTRGRMIQESKVITGSGTFKTMWSYNSADLISAMTYPASNDGSSGEVVNFAYLSQMALDTVIGTTTYIKNTDYDAAGRVDLRDLGVSGSNPVMRVDYTYFNWTDVNGQGRLKQITSGIWSNLTSLQDLRYTYDANGNALTIQDFKAGNPQTQTFTYDALDRLTSAVAAGGSGGKYTLQNYTYDGTTGNLASKAGASYTYGDGSHTHAVTAIGSDSYSYDANGNQTNRTVGGSSYTLSYDAENRLVSVSGAATATFVYDGDGNRVKGIVGSTTAVYIGNHFEWKTSTSNMIKYYYAGSTRVAMRTGSSTLNYLLGDHLGSQAITTNSSGSKSAEIRYYQWGTERYTSGTTPTTYHFTGQRLESYINLYWYGSRWFDPALGRFIQPDSIIPNQNDSQSWDRYCYTSNNPVRYTDPSGHCPWCLVGAIVGAALGYGVQVYNNYNNGYTGIDAWTQNISAEPIIGGAALGATVVAAVPVVVAVAGEVLMGTGAAFGSAELFGIGTTTYAASQALENITYGIPNSANVCRGGTCQASQFSGGTGVVQETDGTLSNVSVTSAGGRSVDTLTAGYPNRSVGVTTAGVIRQAGGSIYPSPILPDNPYHATIDGLTANKLQELFTPTIRNPNIPQ